MVLTGGSEKARIRLRGRALQKSLVGLGVTAVLAAGCAASPEPVDDGSPGVDQERALRGIVIPRFPRRTTTTTTPPTTTTVAPPTTTTPRTPNAVPAPATTFRPAAVTATMGGCTLFPRDHYMNAVNVDTLPVLSESSRWLADLGAGQPAPLRFPTSRIWNGARGGTPLNLVDSRERGFTRVLLNMSYAPRSFPGPYPIPANPKVQGFPSAQWDKHLLVVDVADCRAYELIQYDPFLVALTGIHSALSGASYALDSTAMPPTTTNSPNTPMIGQYIRHEEVVNGEIPHVMAFCSNRISPTWVWPARRSDGVVPGADAMPMGAWIRLKSTVDPSVFPPGARAVVEALRERGAVLTDTCSHSFSLLAENSGDWNDTVMQQLSRLTTSDFEVVDSSQMKVSDTTFQIR